MEEIAKLYFPLSLDSNLIAFDKKSTCGGLTTETTHQGFNIFAQSLRCIVFESHLRHYFVTSKNMSTSLCNANKPIVRATAHVQAIKRKLLRNSQ